MIIFNDYTTYDAYLQEPYGVVRAANELIDGGGWRVVGFALEPQMFCDLAITRA